MNKEGFENQLIHLMNDRPINVVSVLMTIKDAARLANNSDLPIITRLANMSDLFDEAIAISATASLPAWGINGLKVLRNMLEHSFNSDLAQRLLFTISAGDNLSGIKSFFLPENWISDCKITLDSNIIEEAQKIIREIMLSQN